MDNSLQAELLVDCKNLLGECVVYNPVDGRVYWTDVNGHKLLSCGEDGSSLVSRELPEPLGSFAFDPHGNLLAAFASGLFRYRLADGHYERISNFEPQLEATRLNDGRCDRAGRFVVGGCHQGYYNPVSSVISYDGGEPRTLIKNVALTNAIAFSPDGSRMYFSDSETLQLLWFDYDNATGSLGGRHLLHEIPKDQGFADGSCVDASGNLWNARYYGGIVQQYTPQGSLGYRILLPTSCITCACFGGPQLDTLFITTARKDLNPTQLSREPLAGGLFKVRVPARGLSETRFRHVLFS